MERGGWRAHRRAGRAARAVKATAMDTGKVKEIVDKWVIPTPGGAYMAGLENRPVLASASASTVVDTIGREYLDFQSGQMRSEERRVGKECRSRWSPYH